MQQNLTSMQEKESTTVFDSEISLYLDPSLPQKWLPEHETANFLGSDYYRDWKVHSILKNIKLQDHTIVILFPL